jgi:hypothetical protein
MKNYFGFMDETGVLSASSDQRFFALGLLRVEETATLYEQLVKLKNLARNKIIQRSGHPPSQKPFEFKFSAITKSSHTFYYDLIDLFFSFHELSLCVLVLDKKRPDINIDRYFHSTWDAYISFARLLVENHASQDENLCLVADYLGRPKASPLYFEEEISKVPNVYNVCMLESHASLYVQMVDVLIGSVVNDFKIKRGGYERHDVYKRKVSEFLKKKLGRETVAESFTSDRPNDFHVWEFSPD